MSQTLNAAIAVVGIDIGKNTFHIVGHDERGASVLRQKWSRGQVTGPVPHPMIVLGSIFAGWARPTESGAVGVLGAMFIAALNWRMTFKMMNEATYLHRARCGPPVLSN